MLASIFTSSCIFLLPFHEASPACWVINCFYLRNEGTNDLKSFSCCSLVNLYSFPQEKFFPAGEVASKTCLMGATEVSHGHADGLRHLHLFPASLPPPSPLPRLGAGPGRAAHSEDAIQHRRAPETLRRLPLHLSPQVAVTPAQKTPGTP